MRRRACAAALILGLLAGCTERSAQPAAPSGEGDAAAEAPPSGMSPDFVPAGGRPSAMRGEDPGIAFEDATAASGVSFRHLNGARGQKYMQETLGSGVCVFDYDGDGRQDLYFVQSGRLPGYEPPPGVPVRPALFRNLGGGRFEDVTESAGLAGPERYGFGCNAADVDGDGDRDLYLTFYGPNVLYRNEGDGRFTDVTAAAGVGDPQWGASAAFADADGDGDLDLYVANYVAYDMQNDLYCGENRPGWRTVCHPRNFDAQPDVLYRNRGDGRFEDVTRQAGILDTTGKGLGVVWGDIDGDGDQDLYVANDDTPNFLWRNNGDGTFTDIGQTAGVALSEDGVPQAGMGTDMADYDGDGRLDIFVTNLAEETNELYHNDGGGLFSDRTFSSRLGAASLLELGFGTFFFDPDHDGDLDLFVANGHIIDNIALYNDTITFEQPLRLYLSRGDGTFAVAAPAGEPFRRKYVGRGAVPFDLDDDGDEDIVIAQNGRPAVVLRNLGPPRGHWITVTLAAPPPNGDAIGAVVVVESGGVRRMRYARTGSSYLSQADRRLHFGLGQAAGVERVTVTWPGRRGFTEEFAGIAVDSFVTLTQGKGRRVR